MGPDLTSLPRTTACPACGGALRPEATFCSLCFFDFRAAAQPVQQPPPAVPEQPSYGGLDPLTAPLIDLVLPAPTPALQPAPVAPPPPVVVDADPLGLAPTAPVQPTWPCGRCGEPNALDSDLCLTCGSPFLAHAKDTPRLELPYVGDLYTMSRGRRVGLAFGALATLLLPLALVTLLLTPGKSAPQGGQGTQQGTTTTVTTTAP